MVLSTEPEAMVFPSALRGLAPENVVGNDGNPTVPVHKRFTHAPPRAWVWREPPLQCRCVNAANPIGL
jgi:hypothetical protein